MRGESGPVDGPTGHSRARLTQTPAASYQIRNNSDSKMASARVCRMVLPWSMPTKGCEFHRSEKEETSNEISQSILGRSCVRGLRVHGGLVFGTATVQAVLPVRKQRAAVEQIAEDTVVGSGAFQNEGLVYMAYVSAAVYDSVVAIEGGYEPYGTRSVRRPAHRSTRRSLRPRTRPFGTTFPSQAADTRRAPFRGPCAHPRRSRPKSDGRAVGDAAAEGIIDLRTGTAGLHRLA